MKKKLYEHWKILEKGGKKKRKNYMNKHKKFVWGFFQANIIVFNIVFVFFLNSEP